MLYSAAQLTYLEHLGIDVWVPKEIPVHALVTQGSQTVDHEPDIRNEPAFVAPTHYEDMPQPQSVSESTVSAQIGQPLQDASTVASSIAATALNSALTSSIPAPAFPKQTSETYTQTEVKRVEFNIQFWCYSSGVWLISGDDQVTPEQHKLVHNLAQFIQGKKRRPRHVNVFSWPMIDSPNVDQGEEIASKYLLTHIERLQQACEQKMVVVFNDCQYFPQQLPHVKLDTNLQALLMDPNAKKALWQQLLPLQLQD